MGGEIVVGTFVLAILIAAMIYFAVWPIIIHVHLQNVRKSVEANQRQLNAVVSNLRSAVESLRSIEECEAYLCDIEYQRARGGQVQPRPARSDILP